LSSWTEASVRQSDYDARQDSFLRSTDFAFALLEDDVLSRMEVVLETIFEALHRPEMDGRFD
jgi:hypothetical protein